MTTRILVIGAGGVLGRAVATGFAAAGFDVLHGTRQGGGEGQVRVDLDDVATVEDALRGADVVVNTVPHPALAPERLVLHTGGLLLNVSSLTRAQSRTLEGECADARGRVVVHGGLVPGVSSLVARDLVERHPEIDEIEIGMMFSARGTSGPSGGVFAYEALAERAHHSTRRLELAPVSGARRAFEVLPEEHGWLGSIAINRTVRLYISFAEASLHTGLVALNTVRGLRLLPRRPFTRGTVTTGELSTEPIVEWVAGRARGHVVASCSIIAHGDYRSTVAAVIAQLRALTTADANDRIRAGTHPIDDVLRLDDVRQELEAAGIQLLSNSPVSRQPSA